MYEPIKQQRGGDFRGGVQPGESPPSGDTGTQSGSGGGWREGEGGRERAGEREGGEGKGLTLRLAFFRQEGTARARLQADVRLFQSCG